MFSLNRPQNRLSPSKSIPFEQYKTRSRILFLFILFVFIVYSIRLFRLQIIQHEGRLERALRQQVQKGEILVPRGEIKDRKGRVLATSVYSQCLCADVYTVRDRQGRIAGQLSEILKTDDRSLISLLSRKKDMVPIKMNIDSKIIGQVEQMRFQGKLPGIKIIDVFSRKYPHHPVGSQFLGFIKREKVPFHEGLGRIREGRGAEMVEKRFDEVLRSRAGSYTAQVDQYRNQLPKTAVMEKLPEPGNTLWLTLDIEIQAIVEQELEKALREHGADAGSVIVMDPATGELLAVANKPDGEKKSTNNWTSRQRRNRAFTDVLEPGSAIKPLIISMALKEGAVDLDDHFYCGTGYKIGKKDYKDWKDFNRLMDVSEILASSSNIGTIQIAKRLMEKVGAQGYYENLSRFGFGQKTGIALPVESGGILHKPETYTATSFSAISIGYEIGVTPLQLILAFSSIFHEGILMKPRLARAIVDPDGKIIQRFPSAAVRQVMPAHVAHSMESLLKNVVDEGTGKNAAIPGYDVYGKTGTVRLNDHGRYKRARYASIFLGAFKFEGQKLSMLVVIYNPDDDYYGSLVSAPVFQRIGERVISLRGREVEGYA